MLTINELGEFSVPEMPDPDDNRAKAYASLRATPVRKVKDLPPDPRERTCDVCGRRFVPKRGSGKRCSPECSKEARRRYERKRWRERVK